MCLHIQERNDGCTKCEYRYRLYDIPYGQIMQVIIRWTIYTIRIHVIYEIFFINFNAIPIYCTTYDYTSDRANIQCKLIIKWSKYMKGISNEIVTFWFIYMLFIDYRPPRHVLIKVSKICIDILFIWLQEELVRHITTHTGEKTHCDRLGTYSNGKLLYYQRTMYKNNRQVKDVMRHRIIFIVMPFSCMICGFRIIGLIKMILGSINKHTNCKPYIKQIMCYYIIQLYIYKYMTGVITHLNGVDIQSEYSTKWEKWSSVLTYSLN